MKPKVLFIVGPTAVGKTKYAIAAAQAFSGEIISADSMQLYLRMDIGSAKPTAEERAQAVHHLVDQIPPEQSFSVAEYQPLAQSAIQDVLSRGKLPVVSGGTGLYVNSLIYKMDFGVQGADESLRRALEQEAAEKGAEALHARLREKDPEAAERIHPNNVQKIVRALEVLETTGESIPEFEESFVKTDDFEPVLFCLDRDRAQLHQRINKRAELIFEAGLIDEVKGLLAEGLTATNISMKGIGYKEVIAHLNGEYDEARALELVQRNSRRYARRQLIWFRRNPDMHWVNLSDYATEEDALADFLRQVKEALHG